MTSAGSATMRLRVISAIHFVRAHRSLPRTADAKDPHFVADHEKQNPIHAAAPCLKETMTHIAANGLALWGNAPFEWVVRKILGG